MVVNQFDIKHLPKINRGGKGRKWGVIPKIIEDFRLSADGCVEIIDDENRFSNSNNMRKAFKDYILRREIKDVDAVIRGDRVFLIWIKRGKRHESVEI